MSTDLLEVGQRVAIDTTRGVEVSTLIPNEIRMVNHVVASKDQTKKKLRFGTVIEVRTAEDLWADYGRWNGHRDFLGLDKKGRPKYGPPIQIPTTGVWVRISLDGETPRYVKLELGDSRIQVI